MSQKRPLPYKVQKADDVCLIHNKAVILVLQDSSNSLSESDKEFRKVYELEREDKKLEDGWIKNWVIVKLLMADYTGAIELLRQYDSLSSDM